MNDKDKILWKKYNFILIYKNNIASLFSYNSMLRKGKLYIKLTDLANYETDYNLEYSFNDLIRECDDDYDYLTFEDIEKIIFNLLVTYIGSIDYDN